MTEAAARRSRDRRSHRRNRAILVWALPAVAMLVAFQVTTTETTILIGMAAFSYYIAGGMYLQRMEDAVNDADHDYFRQPQTRMLESVDRNPPGVIPPHRYANNSRVAAVLFTGSVTPPMAEWHARRVLDRPRPLFGQSRIDLDVWLYFFLLDDRLTEETGQQVALRACEAVARPSSPSDPYGLYETAALWGITHGLQRLIADRPDWFTDEQRNMVRGAVMIAALVRGKPPTGRIAGGDGSTP